MTEIDLYGDDLAYVHDAGFGDFSRDAAPGLLSALRDHGIDGGLVVDLGCGSGVWASLACDAGYEVLGIDLSPAMIKLARRRAPAASFRVASLLEASIPSCDAVTSLGECVAYVVDESGAETGIEHLFARVYEALRPGGLFIFDLVEPGSERGLAPRRVWRAGEDWAVLVKIEEDPAARLLTRTMTTFRRSGQHYRRSDETHHVRLHEAWAIRAALLRVGYDVTQVDAYGTERFRQGHIGFVARKA